MRIAIINPTGGGMSGGYRTYLRNVLPRLAAHGAVEAVLCATPRAVGVETWLPFLPKVQFMLCRPFRFMRHQPDSDLERSVRAFSPDVVFIPVERYLAFYGLPLVVMLQNMGPLTPVSGNPVSEQLRYLAQRMETRIAVQHANYVIAPSNFVREFLVEQWRISDSRIRTIHYGSTKSIGEGRHQKPPLIPASWQGKFLFTAGSIEPYRGLEDILQAKYSLKDHGDIGGLVIAGATRPNMVAYQRKLARWARRHGIAPQVCWSGILSEEEMAWCYRSCRLFVMTTQVESFAITGLEALIYGCVCIVANNPPLPEIFGDAARYYTPGDGQELAHTIEEALALKPAQKQAATKIVQERTALFSWDQNVEQLLTVFQEVARASRIRGS